jgi:O-antigen ligase
MPSFACFLIVLSLSLLGARFAQSFRCFGRALRAHGSLLVGALRASRAAFIMDHGYPSKTMSQLFFPVGYIAAGGAAASAASGASSILGWSAIVVEL